MKEYRSRNSGRYVFNEDMHNLQDLALSPTELFKDCGLDFVISGCKITVTQNNDNYEVSITSGYVWLDGKIRPVPSFTGEFVSINSIGIYITQPSSPTITYFNGDSDYQYNDYASEINVNFDNQNSTPCLLATIDGNNYEFPNLRTAFFNYYCLMNNGTPGHASSLVVGEIDATTLKINHVSLTDIFVPKAGGTMNSGASLTFVNGSDSTTISGSTLTVGGTISGENLVLSNRALIEGNVTADKFIKDGGTSSQFLKADGSVDSNQYATTNALTNYLLLTGGTLTGALTISAALTVSGNTTINGQCTVSSSMTASSFIKESGTSSQFLKADGSVDNNQYALNSSLSNYLLLTGGTLTGNLIVNAELRVNSTCHVVGDFTNQGDLTTQGDLTAINGSFSGDINAVNGDFTGNIDTATLQASSAEVKNNLTAGSLTVSGNGSFGGTLTISGALTVNSTATINGNTTVNGNVIAQSFIRTNGTASQFLKANGSIDDNVYALNSKLDDYLLLAGGTMTGDLTAPKFIKTGGTSSQFLKGDGSVDTNTYLTTTTATNDYLKKTDAANDYLKKTDATSDYLKKTDAASSYLTKTDAASTYLSKTDASSTYLSKNSASNTYLSKTDAASTYLTINSAIGTYLKKSDAQNWYMPVGANGGGTITSADNYNAQTNILTLGGNYVGLQSNGKEFNMQMNGRSARFYFYCSTPMTMDNAVDINGALTATSITQGSDSNLKNKLGNVSITAEDIAGAPAIRFTWKNNKNDNNIHVGTIAQYWQNVLPDTVFEGVNGLVMEYGPAAMVAVINLAKEVVALKAEIDALKGN